jgi:ABC-type glycerol-3-phosphate transport system substrate-binding protein
MAIGGRWWLVALRTKEYAHLRLGAVPMPVGPTRRIFGGGRTTLVNKYGKNPEGAMAFVEFMHGKEWNDLVNSGADALAPVMKYNYTDDFLHNPEHPEEDYNAVWRTALEQADPEEVSYYVNGAAVDRILRQKRDMIRMEADVPAALRDATRQINAAIVEQLKGDPELKTRYYEELARGAKPAWDRPEDAP